MRILRPLRLAKNVLRARWHLRRIPKGPRTRATGKVFVNSRGDIRIGDRVRFDAKVLPIELGCDENASLTIGDNTYINYGTSIAAAESVAIGKDCLIGTYVMIVDNDFHRLEPERRFEPPDPAPTTLEDNVWIGGHSLVLKGVTIGENSVIAAGSVVTRDVPPNVVYGGNPAKHLRDL